MKKFNYLFLAIFSILKADEEVQTVGRLAGNQVPGANSDRQDAYNNSGHLVVQFLEHIHQDVNRRNDVVDDIGSDLSEDDED